MLSITFGELADALAERNKYNNPYITLSILGKGGKRRVVFVSHEAIIHLERYYALEVTKAHSDKVFALGRERASRVVTDRFENIRISKISAHSLRHSFAIHYLKQGGLLNSLQKLLGHNSITTTEKYLQLVGRDVENDYRKTFYG